MTTALWYGVTEAEQLLSANLLRGVMLSCLYGNPRADIDEGPERIRQIFKAALKTMPYIRFSDDAADSETDKLIEEWRRANASAGEQSADGKEGD